MTAAIWLRKGAEIDEDVVDGDLILMHLQTRSVVILNAAARALWEVIEDFSGPSEMLELLREALPEQPTSEVERGLDELLTTLKGQGFVAAAA
jgi:Coenzyme PQQ synthesis protein D (PqqD)